MPENKSESAIIPDGEAVPEAAGAETVQAGNAWVEFERGRLSRRQALKKLGMTSAMATFALFSVDDLARMVGKAMQQRAADNKIVEQVAQELQQAGVALADPGDTPCSHCVAQLGIDTQKATKGRDDCILSQMLPPLNSSQDQATAFCNATYYCPEVNDAFYAYNGCSAAHCSDPGQILTTQLIPACVSLNN